MGGEGRWRARNGLEQGGETGSVLDGINIAPLYLRWDGGWDWWPRKGRGP